MSEPTEEQPQVEASKPKPPERHYPERVMEYAQEMQDWDHEGYYWLILPEHHSLASFANIFGVGGSLSRALACDRCGLMVSESIKHNAWHKDVDELIATVRELTERRMGAPEPLLGDGS